MTWFDNEFGDYQQIRSLTDLGKLMHDCHDTMHIHCPACDDVLAIYRSIVWSSAGYREALFVACGYCSFASELDERTGQLVDLEAFTSAVRIMKEQHVHDRNV